MIFPLNRSKLSFKISKWDTIFQVITFSISVYWSAVHYVSWKEATKSFKILSLSKIDTQFKLFFEILSYIYRTFFWSGYWEDFTSFALFMAWKICSRTSNTIHKHMLLATAFFETIHFYLFIFLLLFKCTFAICLANIKLYRQFSHYFPWSF